MRVRADHAVLLQQSVELDQLHAALAEAARLEAFARESLLPPPSPPLPRSATHTASLVCLLTAVAFFVVALLVLLVLISMRRKKSTRRLAGTDRNVAQLTTVVPQPPLPFDGELVLELVLSHAAERGQRGFPRLLALVASRWAPPGLALRAAARRRRAAPPSRHHVLRLPPTPQTLGGGGMGSGSQQLLSVVVDDAQVGGWPNVAAR
jgi:hypothetical protein